MRPLVLALASIAAFLAGCARPQGSHEHVAPPPDQKPVARIATEYRTYRQVTAEPVEVNYELSLSCIGVSQANVERAAVTHGPHAYSAVLIFMNDVASKAFAEGRRLYPVGSVVVKEKELHTWFVGKNRRKDRGATNGVGGMVKRPPGYDPAHGDWEFFYFEKPANIESGRLPNCIQCHETAAGGDHVFGTWRSHGS